MFPFDIEEDEVSPAIEEEKIPTDYEIDFKTGKLTGRIITGLDAIKQWARIVLSTDRYYYPQYSWNHGSDLSSLIGQNYDQAYIHSEVQRMIEDALLVDENITGISNLECSFDKDKLTAKFTIETIFGGGEISV